MHSQTDRINALLDTSLQVDYRAIHRSPEDETIDDLSIDCAVVCVPDHLHFEVTDALMRRNIHCLIVKPLVPTLNRSSHSTATSRGQGALLRQSSSTNDSTNKICSFEK